MNRLNIGGRYVTAVLVCLFLICSGDQLRSQNRPLESTRTALVTALNNFLIANRTATSGSQPFIFDGAQGTGSEDDLYLYDPLDAGSPDGCDQIDENLELTFEFSTSTFKLSRLIRPARNVTLPKLDHELVDDLNDWLNAVWALEMKGVAEFDALDNWQCSQDGSVRFYTAVSTDVDAIAALKELTGENEILNKWYNINGVWRRGSEILVFHEGSTRELVYMTDRGDPAVDEELRDTIRFLANAFVGIELGGNASAVAANDITDLDFRLEIEMHTTPYSSSACTPINDDSYQIQMLVNDATAPAQPGPGIGCPAFGWFKPLASQQAANTYEEAGAFSNADSANKRMFRYVYDHRGQWWHNPSPDRVLQLGYFSVDEWSGDMIFTVLWSDCCEHTVATVGHIMSNTIAVPDEYCEATYCTPTFEEVNSVWTIASGGFTIDPDYGRVMYAPPVDPNTQQPLCTDCTPAPVPCLIFCDDVEPVNLAVTGALSANARTFSDATPLTIEDDNLYLPGSVFAFHGYRASDYEQGLRGIWRVQGEYVYRTDIVGGSGKFGNANERVWNDAGTFVRKTDPVTSQEYDLELFNWRHIDRNNEARWLNPSRVTRYSQNGEPVEEVDIYGIPSTAHFGYFEQVPVLVAKNASYESVYFESFEDGKGNAPGVGHTGGNSFLVGAACYDENMTNLWPQSPTTAEAWKTKVTNQSIEILTSLFIDDYLLDVVGENNRTDGGLLLRFWAKPFYGQVSGIESTVSPIELKLEIEGVERGVIPYTDIKLVAKTCEWGLFEAVINTLSDPNINITSVDIGKIVKVRIGKIYGGSNTKPVWIDDVRLQPMKSEMVCYVYDPENLRQVAQLDDQHFAVYFQYNDEGKLVRRRIETERGIRTVQETQYNTPLVNRAYGQTTVTSSAPLVFYQQTAFSANSNFSSSPQFELLSLELGLDRRQLTLFGQEPANLQAAFTQLDSLLSLTELADLDLPLADKIELLEELRAVNEQLDSLNEVSDYNQLDSSNAEIEATRQVLIIKRTELLNKLDIDLESSDGILERINALEANTNIENQPNQ